MSQSIPIRPRIEPSTGSDRARAWSVLAAWAAAALVASSALPFSKIPVAVPVSIVGLVGASVGAFGLSLRFRNVANALGTRPILLLHAARLPIGMAFLYELSCGRLPAVFASRAGWGDIAIGAAALLLALARAPSRRTLVLFNALGLADIMVAVGTASHLFFVLHDGRFPAALERFPYGMLPTFVVPLVIGTHLLMFVRLSRRQTP